MTRAVSPPELDSFDLAILRILQNDSTMPQRQIGEQVNLSAPSVQRRIKKMQSQGVIAHQVAVVEPASVGLSLTIVVEVELHDEAGEKIGEIKQHFLDAPEIQQCYYVAGEADFVLIIVVADMAEYETLTRRLFFSNANIRKFKTLVAMDRVKTTMRVNI